MLCLKLVSKSLRISTCLLDFDQFHLENYTHTYTNTRTYTNTHTHGLRREILAYVHFSYTTKADQTFENKLKKFVVSVIYARGLKIPTKQGKLTYRIPLSLVLMMLQSTFTDANKRSVYCQYSFIYGMCEREKKNF